jgi:hypothetical protein
VFWDSYFKEVAMDWSPVQFQSLDMQLTEGMFIWSILAYSLAAPLIVDDSLKRKMLRLQVLTAASKKLTVF